MTKEAFDAMLTEEIASKRKTKAKAEENRTQRFKGTGTVCELCGRKNWEHPHDVCPKALVALQKDMREFDPECEKHHPLLIVKAVDPGCTLEIQIENAVTGKVTRITSTESEKADMEAFEAALLAAFREAWRNYGQ
jgi:hypothetical protein